MAWGPALTTVLEAFEVEGDRIVPRVRGHVRGTWLLQTTSLACGPGSDDPDCHAENVHILLLVALLCFGIFSILGTYCSIREDKEEQLTPLCPQLIVKDAQLKFKLPLDYEKNIFEILDSSDELVCRAAVDWPDHPKRGHSGVAATVRVQSSADVTLATVVAREAAVAGQELALCRASCEIFGFIVHDATDPNLYSVRHRSGVELLSIHGEFDPQTLSVSMVNPAGVEVCSVRRVGDFCYGTVLQHVDAGLVLSALFAANVNRKLAQVAPVVDCVSSPPLSSPGSSRSRTPTTPRQRLCQQPPQVSVSQVSGAWPPPSAARGTPGDSREGSEVAARPSVALRREGSGTWPPATTGSDAPPEMRTGTVLALRRVGFEAPSGDEGPGRSIFPSPHGSAVPSSAGRGSAGGAAPGGVSAAASAAPRAGEPEEEPECLAQLAAAEAAPGLEAPMAVSEAAAAEGLDAESTGQPQ